MGRISHLISLAHLLGASFHNAVEVNAETVETSESATVQVKAETNKTSEKNILTLAQPYSNHNGGTIEFRKDGYLYIGLGDGGSTGDAEKRAQDPSNLFGKKRYPDTNNFYWEHLKTTNNEK